MPKSNTKPISTQPSNNPFKQITATSQQTRFHVDTLESQTEIDLHGVGIAIGERELLVDVELKLKAGTRYALVGRNGTGKSTLFTCLHQKLIPGLGKAIRILLLSQLDDSTAQGADEEETVLQHVVRSDRARCKVQADFELISCAVESGSSLRMQQALAKLELDKAQEALDDAKDLANRRSGARGKEARIKQLQAEEIFAAALKTVQEGDAMHVDDGVANEALSVMADLGLTMEVTEVAKMSAEAATILSGLGFSQTMIDGPFAALSGGWKSRCSLAGSLLIQSDVLLLDEPSNFLDLDATLWLERHLSTQTRTVVITSHDQMFLENVVDETILIRNCSLTYFDGTPRSYEINQKKEARRNHKQREAMAKKKEHIEASIQKGKETAKKTGDENRLRMVKSRQKKLDDRWGIEQSAKGGRFKLNRDLAGYHLTSRAEIVQEDAERRVKISLPQPTKLRTSGDLIHFQDVAFRYPKTKNNVVQGVTFTVGQTGRCSFIGANGEGKSTIAKLVLGELQPTSGTITRHPTMKIGYFSQMSVEELSALPEQGDGPVTPLTHFMAYFAEKGQAVEEKDARSFLGGLGLPGKLSSHTPVKALSGGQKVRLAFALIMWDPPHLLLLDEITTHVDVPTIEALALSLRRYSGAIILVTHDRWFNRVVIEGIPPRDAFDHEGLDDSASESSSEDEDVPKGVTYRVGGGKVRLTAGGMTQYIGIVERRMAKREAAKDPGKGLIAS